MRRYKKEKKCDHKSSMLHGRRRCINVRRSCGTAQSPRTGVPSVVFRCALRFNPNTGVL